MSQSIPSEIIERALARAQRAGASEVDAVLAEGDEIEARVRDAEIDFVSQARGRTLGIRALVRGNGGARSAMTSTSDVSPDAIDAMADQAVALARATAEDPAAGLPDGGFATDHPALELFDPQDRGIGVEARIEDAMTAEAAARATDARIDNSEGTQVSSGFSHIAYGNSKGFFGEYDSASHSLFSEPVAKENGSLQRDYWMTVSRRLGDLEDPASVGRRAAERALRRLGSRAVKTCEVPVIFDPLTAASLVRQLVGCISGYAVYRETSFLAGRLGEDIAATAINVIDDGRRRGGLGSKPFDGEGLPTQRTALVENGRLSSYLLDTYSARKLGMESTGNASRGAGSAPTAAPSNVWLEPGDQSLDEIIADTDRGFIATELIGMGFNPITGDYSRGAAGLWVERGEIVQPVEEVTIAGNFGDMLNDIDAIGSDLLWMGRVASPSLRIANMTLAGE